MLFFIFIQIVGKPSSSDQFEKIIKRYKKWDTTWILCDSLHPITVYSYGFLLNCTTVGQASDSLTALTLSSNPLLGA